MSDGPSDCARALWCQQERERREAERLTRLDGYAHQAQRIARERLWLRATALARLESLEHLERRGVECALSAEELRELRAMISEHRAGLAPPG